MTSLLQSPWATDRALRARAWSAENMCMTLSLRETQGNIRVHDRLQRYERTHVCVALSLEEARWNASVVPLWARHTELSEGIIRALLTRSHSGGRGRKQHPPQMDR